MNKSSALVLVAWSLVYVIQAQPACQPKICPPGFTFYQPSSKCYALINTLMNRDAHIAQCSRLAVGAFIAAPLDAGEDRFIRSLIEGQSGAEQQKCRTTDTKGFIFDHAYFLGAESCERKLCKTFLWVMSGGLRQKMEYTNFRTGEPNCADGTDEYCINFHGDFTWNDISCRNNFCSVCEFRLLK